jgi:hypothetical protein
MHICWPFDECTYVLLQVTKVRLQHDVRSPMHKIDPVDPNMKCHSCIYRATILPNFHSTYEQADICSISFSRIISNELPRSFSICDICLHKKISARRTSESWWNSKSDNQSISDQSGCSVYSFRHPIFPSLVCNVSIDVLREFTWECSILFSIGDSVTHSWKAEFSPGCFWFWSLYPFYSHHSLQRSRPCIVFYCTMDRYKNLHLCNYCKLLHHV